MSEVTSLRRATASVAAVLALGLTVAACSTGPDALTAMNYTPADGVQADSGQVGARNLLLVSDGSGATLSGVFADAGATADAVTSIAVGATKATLVAGSGLTIPAAGTLTFGSTGGDGPQAYLTGTFSPGRNVTMTVTFDQAAPITLRVPVLARTGYYTAVPTPVASAAGA